MPEFDGAAFDAAAIAAKQDLEKLVAGFTPEQREAHEKVKAWWKKYYMTAGHKRLGRVLVDKFVPGSR